MAVTTVADLTSIQQVGPASINVALQSTPLLAFPELVLNCAKRIKDAGGETIAFPYWESVVTAKDVVRNSRTGVVPDKLTLKSHIETAESKVVSVDGDRYAMEDAADNAKNHLAYLTGIEFGKAIQSSLITKALDPVNGTNLMLNVSAVAGGGKLTVDSILQARCQWGDNSSSIQSPVLFLRTSQFADLAISSDYKTAAAGFSPTVVDAAQNGLIVGRVFGIPLVLLDSIPATVDGANTYYDALLVGAGAFGVYIADDPKSVIIDIPGSSVQVFDVHHRFSTTCFKSMPRRVVKIRTK
jgi:hypothetical protein